MTINEINQNLKDEGFNVSNVYKNCFDDDVFILWYDKFIITVIKDDIGFKVFYDCNGYFGNVSVLSEEYIHADELLAHISDRKYINDKFIKESRKRRLKKLCEYVKNGINIIFSLILLPFVAFFVCASYILIFISFIVYIAMFPITLPIYILYGFWYPEWFFDKCEKNVWW